jgi:hypothetical protein
MDYTTSADHVVDATTGNRRHDDQNPITTVWSAADSSMLIWSLMEIIKEAELEGKPFNPADPASYGVLKAALQKLYITPAKLVESLARDVPPLAAGAGMPSDRHVDFSMPPTTVKSAPMPAAGYVCAGFLVVSTPPTGQKVRVTMATYSSPDDTEYKLGIDNLGGENNMVLDVMLPVNNGDCVSFVYGGQGETVSVSFCKFIYASGVPDA